jgi:hypothetical protein
MHIREGLLGSIKINLLYGLMFYPEHEVIRFIRSIKYSGRVLPQCAVPYHRRCNCHSHSHENLKSHIHYSHYYKCKLAIRSTALEVYSGRRESLTGTDS